MLGKRVILTLVKKVICGFRFPPAWAASTDGLTIGALTPVVIQVGNDCVVTGSVLARHSWKLILWQFEYSSIFSLKIRVTDRLS